MADKKSWLVMASSVDCIALAEILTAAGYKVEQVGSNAFEPDLPRRDQSLQVDCPVVIVEKTPEGRRRELLDVKTALFAAVPDLIFRISRDYRLIGTNKADENEFYYVPPSQFLYKSVRDVLPEDVADRIVENVDLVLRTGEPCTWDYSLNLSGELRYFEARMARCGDEVIAVSSDVTERHRAEQEQRIRAEAFHLMSSAPTLNELARKLVALIKDYAGCEAVGIRLKDGHDYLYWETSGFSKEFLQAENSLHALDSGGKPILDASGKPIIECMCGNVIEGRTDPARPYFTEFGSFWTNTTSELLGTGEFIEAAGNLRCRCALDGYESVALVPLRAAGERFGLLQFNDRRKGCFSESKVKVLENIAEGLAATLAHRQTMDALRKSEASLMGAQRLVRLGSYEVAFLDGGGVCSDQTNEIIGLEKGKTLTLDEYYNLVHPEDRERVRQVMCEIVSQRNANELDFRLLLPDGTLKYVHSVAQAVEDPYGRVDRLFGTLMDITERKQTEEDLAKAREALEIAYRREHHIADVLQHALIPEVDVLRDGYHVLARYLPALDEAEVGGDFYDVFRLRNGNLALVIGDVSGKGLTAAVHTAMMKYTIRAYAHEDSSPALVMERLNRTIYDTALEDLFVTAFYGVLDMSQGVFTYANAGHDLPLHVSKSSGRAVPLAVTGKAIGFVRNSGYSQQTCPMEVGDSLVLYTDGITDARSHGRFFGIEGLAEVVAANADAPSKNLIEAAIQAALEVSEGKLHDDCAMLVLKRES